MGGGGQYWNSIGSNPRVCWARTGVCLHPPLPAIIFSPVEQGTFSKTAGQSQAYYNTWNWEWGTYDVTNLLILTCEVAVSTAGSVNWQESRRFCVDHRSPTRPCASQLNDNHDPLLVEEWVQARSTPANTRRWTNVGLMLDQRRRRWPNNKPTLFQRLVVIGPHCMISLWTVLERQ